MNSRKPILVTGSHRSGTTWVGQTIAQHPGVRYIGEPFNVDHPNAHFGLQVDTWFTHYPSSNQQQAISAAFDKLLKPHPLTYAASRVVKIDPDARLRVRRGRRVLRQLGWARQRALIKDPLALLSAGWLHEAYGAMVVLMIRHPLAFVGSIKKAEWDLDFSHLHRQKALMSGLLRPFADRIAHLCTPEGVRGTDLVDRAALVWNILHFAILDYRTRYPNWLFVTHEDLTLDPTTGFRRIFDYLELSFDPAILEYIERYTSAANPAESGSTTYQPRDAKSTAQAWKQRLSLEETERVNAATREIAAEFYAHGREPGSARLPEGPRQVG